jgi:hypothetical protein
MRITRSSVRLVLILSVIVALAVPLGLFAYNHAHADNPPPLCGGYSGYPYCKTVTQKWTWNSRQVDRNGLCCISVFYSLDGHIGYNRLGAAKGGVRWVNQTLLDPVLHATVSLCAPEGCVNDEVDQMQLIQDWTGWDCTFNPSFGFSVPWGLSFSAWRICDSRNLTQDPRPDAPIVYPRGHSFTQNNSGDSVTFPEYDGSPQVMPCYGVEMSSIIVVRTSSDEFDGGAREECLP